ncbi:MAG TPA: DUF6653 family protein [Hyphomicrobiaceae bacterium]|nr:DUF6653 family protein [Hyphomicrobiaceae bacterium]
MMMDDATWKRHANPWSVWTRFLILPLLVLAVWSRSWIGWWFCLPVALLIMWTYLNPRVFPKPRSTNNWASKATFGERVWLKRKQKPIPAHHARFAHMLSAATALAVIPLVIGFIRSEPLVTCLSLALVAGGKLWFLDRMVWLYHDVKDSDPEYASWLY